MKLVPSWLYTENSSMRYYIGFLQTGSQITGVSQCSQYNYSFHCKILNPTQHCVYICSYIANIKWDIKQR